ncbi:hypothetical protein KIW84_064117 [Lathyrus oleraceus]|uniref:Putative plant transposon protein domain-containing protein n=1 Tax=Pisum sativum TaxID=3888 RepID=A0A9D4WAT9_PEA|nr:hypothetical protein KIW84_064117 [Pisum sativum]
MANRKIWDEKRFEINRQGDHRNIVIQMGNKNWCVLINPPKNLNHDMVREFYANALSSEGNPFTFTTMIRGRTIHFNMDVINEYLENPMAEESHFHLHMDTSHLLYLIIKGIRVDVARTIANEMKILVESGEEPGTGAKAIHPLVIPGLIMGLIRVAHTVIPKHAPTENGKARGRNLANLNPGSLSNSCFMVCEHTILPGGKLVVIMRKKKILKRMLRRRKGLLK